MTATLALLAAGLLVLVLGAEVLVRGASSLAASLGVPPLLVGLTVVAYGTSAPEFAVSIGAGLAGRGGLAVGNVLGSNVFNVLFILGLSAAIVPLAVSARLVRFDVPLLIGVTAGAWALAGDGALSRADGILLFAGAVLYTAFLAWQAHGEATAPTAQTADASAPPDGAAPAPRRMPAWALQLAGIVAGLVLLAWGARMMVAAAVDLALRIGLSELVVGLTVVAIGTSLPEIAASLAALARRQRDIAVGNVIGSNLVNLLGVLGATAVLAPGGLPVSAGAASFDFPVAAAVALACLPIFFTGGRIARWEGLLLFGFYLAYLAYVLLQAGAHEVLGDFRHAMTFFVIPLAVLTLLAVSGRELWSGRRRR